MHTGVRGTWCEARKLTPNVFRYGSSIADPNEDDSNHPCRYCGSVFTGKRRLWHHIRTEHMGSRFVCPQCQCTFASRGGLREHVKHIHQQLARYHCEHCGKGYSIRSNYYDHVATHTGAKRNVCHICQNQFTFNYSLKVHIRRCHPNEAKLT